MQNNVRLADILRPHSFDEIVGQSHLFGERGVVRKMIESGRVTNMIFYGPPGTGKTTAAEIIARQSGMAASFFTSMRYSISIKSNSRRCLNILRTAELL